MSKSSPPPAPRPDNTSISRRDFVRGSALSAVAFSLPGALRADPYAPLATPTTMRAPVRVRGRVRSNGEGVAGVAVSDGLEVVATNGDGDFELVTQGWSRFVRISVPAGYRIPVGANGTASHYRRIAPNSGGEMTAAFDLERLAGSDENHTFLFWPDTQTQDALEMGWLHEQSVPDVIALARELGDQALFGIACGDIMYDDLSLYPEYERAVTRMGIPFFQAVGNHDLNYDARISEASTETFSQHFGPDYYSFDRGRVHYVVLNDVFWHGAGYLGYLPREQLTWLENDLRLVEPGRTVIVATHIPILSTGDLRRGSANPGTGGSVANREALYRLLEPYNAHILSGHTHENEQFRDGGARHHVSGTVCGAWWSGPICGDGTPNGYSVYEIRGERVTHRYKPTGQPFSYQLRAYAHGADPAAPNEIAANVWDWQDDWTVVWYEDGEPKGRMAQRKGFDPWSLELHTGPELPPRRAWVDPYPTEHLFYAPASREAREILIEATDGQGRRYSARVGDPFPGDPGLWTEG
ncbi:MAG: hypothetical protein GEU90_04285 [Gemmatimonas sp.]|nr:hypothetical protein [Gemmatimonas sp.]